MFKLPNNNFFCMHHTHFLDITAQLQHEKSLTSFFLNNVDMNFVTKADLPPYVNLYKYHMKINLLLSFLLIIINIIVIIIIIIITTIISVITITFNRLLNAVDKEDEGCFLWIADHQSPESQKGTKMKNFKFDLTQTVYLLHTQWQHCFFEHNTNKPRYHLLVFSIFKCN